MLAFAIALGIARGGLTRGDRAVPRPRPVTRAAAARRGDAGDAAADDELRRSIRGDEGSTSATCDACVTESISCGTPCESRSPVSRMQISTVVDAAIPRDCTPRGLTSGTRAPSGARRGSALRQASSRSKPAASTAKKSRAKRADAHDRSRRRDAPRSRRTSGSTQARRWASKKRRCAARLLVAASSPAIRIAHHLAQAGDVILGDPVLSPRASRPSARRS